MRLLLEIDQRKASLLIMRYYYKRIFDHRLHAVLAEDDNAVNDTVVG